MRIRFFLKEVHRRSSLKQFLYLVVVGVETLDDVDTEEDVDTELEVEALKTIIYKKKKRNWHLMALYLQFEKYKVTKITELKTMLLYIEKKTIKEFE